VDDFELEAAVGELQAIRIGHDNTGCGASWHLQVWQITSQVMVLALHWHFQLCQAI
jgi:hypothetical protein